MAITKIPAAGFTGNNFRNILINGDMSIDQRNDGASVTMGSTQYPVDRFSILNNTSQAATNSMQRVTDAPTGFKYSAKFTTGTGAAATASQQARFSQAIEGNNIINLSYGTASAKTLSLSFWVKASQTGTFGGSLRKDNGTRSYPFTYTISSASTWEYKTIVIPGDTTTGTWVSDNNVSLLVYFDLGTGSNFLRSPGAWDSFNALGATGGTSTVAVTGATWQITGVQLEAETTASDFEFLPYDVNLGRCKRYYQQRLSSALFIPRGYGSEGYVTQAFSPEMRTNPTMTWTTTYVTTNALSGHKEGIRGYVGSTWTGSPDYTYKADAEL